MLWFLRRRQRHHKEGSWASAHVFSGNNAEAPLCPQHSISLGFLNGVGPACPLAGGTEPFELVDCSSVMWMVASALPLTCTSRRLPMLTCEI